MEEMLRTWQEAWTPELKERELPDTKFSSRKIITFTGVRRCGKTYMMFQRINELAKTVPKESIFYINFEDERVEKRTEVLTNLMPSLMKLYGDGNKKYYLFLDELQVMPEWSRWLRRVLDGYRNIELFVSGSSSALSSREIPTELRGRAVNFEITPLSFREFLSFGDIKFEKDLPLTERERGTMSRALSEYLEYGGFPEVAAEQNPSRKAMLVQEYFRTIVSRDIAERHNLKNTGLLSDFLRMVVNTTNFSVNKTVNVLKSQGRKVGKGTILNYTRFAADSYFCSFVPVFSHKVKDMEQHPKKVYLADNAFLTFISTKFSKNWGRLYENSVFLHLKGKQNSNPLIDIFYWKDSEAEVDFVIKDSEKVMELIQVCQNPSDYDTKSRECRALVKASKELGCKKLSVITEDYEKTESFEWRGTEREIKFVPLWKFLLS